MTANTSDEAGFTINVSRTINAPVEALFEAWTDGRRCRSWLADHHFVIRSVVPNKTVRLTWVDGRSWVETTFRRKGARKTEVVVEHSRLPDSADAARMKPYWGEALDALKAKFEPADAGPT